MQEQTGTPLTADPIGHAQRLVEITRFWCLALGVVVIDQVSKWVALRELTPGVEHPLIGDLLSFRLTRNSGAAFSAFDGMTYVVTALAVVIVLGIVHRIHTKPVTRWLAVVLGFIVGGALGNLIDRFAREPGIGRGHVIDFIDYGGLFVGNVADIAIVLAAIAYVVHSVVRPGTPGSVADVADRDAPGLRDTTGASDAGATGASDADGASRHEGQGRA